MTILYFSATGNSLYVAKQFEARLISIPQAIRAGRYEFEDDSIGIVCPIYKNLPPQIVINFLKRATLSAKYKFLILTYGHTNFGAAALAGELLAELELDYIQTILMVDNYLPAFDINSEQKLNKKLDSHLADIMSDISSRAKSVPKMRLKDRINYAAISKYFEAHPELNDGSQIVITRSCIGCGICQKVCPTGNIALEDGVATRRSKSCLFCLACANLCTAKAIIINGEKNPTARYRNPNISLHELINSNVQI